MLAVPGLHDTQCGFKLFTAAAAEAGFDPARLDGFSFDVETLFIARRRGLRIAEVPGHLAQRRGLAGRAGERLPRLRSTSRVSGSTLAGPVPLTGL